MVEAVTASEAVESRADYSRDMSGIIWRRGWGRRLQMVRAYVKYINIGRCTATPYALAPRHLTRAWSLDVAHRNSIRKSQLFWI
jgi:hypothetical protein